MCIAPGVVGNMCRSHAFSLLQWWWIETQSKDMKQLSITWALIWQILLQGRSSTFKNIRVRKFCNKYRESLAVDFSIRYIENRHLQILNWFAFRKLMPVIIWMHRIVPTCPRCRKRKRKWVTKVISAQDARTIRLPHQNKH